MQTTGSRLVYDKPLIILKHLYVLVVISKNVCNSSIISSPIALHTDTYFDVDERSTQAQLLICA